jgi:hypothetical protein
MKHQSLALQWAANEIRPLKSVAFELRCPPRGCGGRLTQLLRWLYVDEEHLSRSRLE